MAVADVAWLGVWWPWLLVWVATAALIGCAVWIVLAQRRRANRAVAHHHGIPIYLDKRSVTDLYSQDNGRYAAALRREVEKRISRNRRVRAAGSVGAVDLDAEHGVTEDVFEKFVTNDDPISVILTLIRVLRKADDVVDVNLVAEEITASDALRKALHHPQPGRRVDLRQVDAFVLVHGRFQRVDTHPGTTLQAPFGFTPDPVTPTLRIVCHADGLRTGDLPRKAFPARCLGRIEDWDQATSTLAVHPIAVFR